MEVIRVPQCLSQHPPHLHLHLLILILFILNAGVSRAPSQHLIITLMVKLHVEIMTR